MLISFLLIILRRYDEKILQIVDADFSLSWLVSNCKRKDIPLCHHR